jgi:transposase-like protein
LERLNKELKRRCKVVGIFPTESALIRLAGAVLLDTHEECAERDDGDAEVGELERVTADRHRGSRP